MFDTETLEQMKERVRTLRQRIKELQAAIAESDEHREALREMVPILGQERFALECLIEQYETPTDNPAFLPDVLSLFEGNVTDVIRLEDKSEQEGAE